MKKFAAVMITASLMMITLASVPVRADEKVTEIKIDEKEVKDGRMLAGQKDFNKDYLEKVTDERAADRARHEKDRKDHDKYLREIDRSR